MHRRLEVRTRHEVRTWQRRAGAAAGAVVVTAVAACAAPSATVHATGGETSAAPSATAPATGGGTPGALPRASCGWAVTHLLGGDTRILQTAQRTTLGCFDAAARHCAAAGIQVTEMGVDTGTNYVFTIMPSGAGCQVTEWNQAYSAAGLPRLKRPVNAAVCRLTAVTGAGVTVSCAGRNLLIPTTVTAFG